MRGCAMFQFHFRIILRDTWTGYFHDNLTLPKLTEKSWLERDNVARISRVLKLDKNSLPIPVDSRAQQVEWRTGIPKMRVQIPLVSTFFNWLRQYQIIMKNFCSCISEDDSETVAVLVLFISLLSSFITQLEELNLITPTWQIPLSHNTHWKPVIWITFLDLHIQINTNVP